MKQTKNNSIIYITTILLLLTITTACTQQNITGQAINDEIENKKAIKIGATLALTGSLSYIGINEYNGMQMAIDEINNDNTRNIRIELSVEDNKGDAKEGINNVQKLIAIDNSQIIFSAFTHITQAVKGTVFENNKILFYASTVPSIAGENENAYRDYIDAGDHGTELAKTVLKEGYTEIYFLTEKSEQCVLFEEAFNRESQRLGIKIIEREEFLSTDQDLKTNILKLNVKKDKAIVTCTWRHEHIFMKQLKELGLINVKTFHILAPFLSTANEQEIRQLFKENNAVSTWYGFGESQNSEKQKEFIEKYKTKYGVEPTPDAAYAYDDIYILAQAAETCEQDSTECITKNIAQTQYDGVGGHIEFNNRLSKRDVVMIEMNENNWTVMS